MRRETIDRILKFRDDRDWKQFHTPKDLAMSVSIEAAELLENFQWTASNADLSSKMDNIADELADVLIYCTYMADTLGLDIDQIINDKLLKNNKKYAVEHSYGSSKKYTELGE